MKNISLNLDLHTVIKNLEMDFVNEEISTPFMKYFLVISVVIILVVNSMIIFEITKEKNFTFINVLVLLDCIDSLAHIFILLQFF